jgi:hypothetical protein
VVPKYRAVMEKFTRQVKDGAYKTRKEAEQALRDADKAFRDANPPPGLDRKGGEKKP